MSAAPSSSADHSAGSSFFVNHEFAIRRVHSLLGLVPLGLYMVVHLTTNASLMNGSETFQKAVYLIHSPGQMLPIIEWALIFLPLVFHAVIGVWIARTARYNDDHYKFTNNRRYVFQRWTGVIALVYLFFHILHMHGWFHAELWLNMIQPIGFGQFKPYNAASTLVAAMQGFLWPAFYLVGTLACVYHLANGLWTAGITWGLWISPEAQKRASQVCSVVGVGLALVAVTAWWAAVAPGQKEITEYEKTENRMYDASVEAGWISPSVEKRSVEKRSGDHE